MFTVKEGSEISVDLIREAIEYNEKLRKTYNGMENYYIGKHNIIHRHKPIGAKNTIVITNHAKYIVDMNVGYLLGNPVSYKALDENINIQPVLDEYSKQVITDLDVEIAKDIATFGIQYELIYNSGNDIKSKDIDVRNAVCVYDDTVEHKKLFGVIYDFSDESRRKFSSVTVYSEKYRYENCADSTGDLRIGDRFVHSFGKVPLIEYRNNNECMGDFAQVITLIDAYNILQSDRINDKEQLVEAILLGYGIEMTDEQKKNLKTERMIFNLPPKGEADIEYLSKSLDEAQIDILRRNIENDIHKISLTPNMSDENFAGNASGVALAYKLLPFEQNVKNKERFFEKGLMERFEIYNNYLVSISKSTKYDTYKVDAVFKRNLPQNLLEISQIINNLTGLVDDETLAGLLPFVERPKEVVEANRKEEMEKYRREISEFGSTEPTSELIE
jgi:SPP1 family phage portal protein